MGEARLTVGVLRGAVDSRLMVGVLRGAVDSRLMVDVLRGAVDSRLTLGSFLTTDSFFTEVEAEAFGVADER